MERIETTIKSDEKWNELTRIKLKTVNKNHKIKTKTKLIEQKWNERHK